MASNNPASRQEVVTAVITALSKVRDKRTAAVPRLVEPGWREPIDRDETRRSLAALLEVSVDSVDDVQLNAAINEITAAAEQSAATLATHIASLAEHFEAIGCVAEGAIIEYFHCESKVLGELYSETERASPSPSRLRRLALQYALDARTRIQGSSSRFSIERHEDGYHIRQYPIGAIRNSAIPYPARRVRNGFAVAVLDFLEADPPKIWQLRKFLELLLDQPELKGPPVPTRASAAEVFVDIEHQAVTIKGRVYPLEMEQVALIGAVVKADGLWVSGRTLAADDALIGQRPDRILRGLRPEIRALIAAERGKGYRLRTEMLE